MRDVLNQIGPDLWLLQETEEMFKNTDPTKHTQDWRKKLESLKRKEEEKSLVTKSLQSWLIMPEVPKDENLDKLQEV